MAQSARTVLVVPDGRSCLSILPDGPPVVSVADTPRPVVPTRDRLASERSQAQRADERIHLTNIIRAHWLGRLREGS